MANKTHMGIGAVIALLVAAYLGLDLSESKQQTNTFCTFSRSCDSTADSCSKSTHKLSDDTQRIEQAYQQRQSDLQVQASGKVIALLKMIMKVPVIRNLFWSYPLVKLYWLRTILIWHHASRIFKKGSGCVFW